MTRPAAFAMTFLAHLRAGARPTPHTPTYAGPGRPPAPPTADPGAELLAAAAAVAVADAVVDVATEQPEDESPADS